jgi:hypothetical protein
VFVNHQERIQGAVARFMARKSKGSEDMVIGNMELMRAGNKVFIRDLSSRESTTFTVEEIAALIEKHFRERF